MQFIRYWFLFIVIGTMSISCKKDFLTVPDKTSIIRQTYVKDLTTTNEFLKGLYIQHAENFDYVGLTYPELVADNIKPLALYEAFYGWKQEADDNRSRSPDMGHLNANGFWNVNIVLAQGCSFVAECSDKYRAENSELADNLKGQAYVLRALSHFVMVNVFAQSYSFKADASHPGVPYIVSSDWTIPIFRLSVSEVYAAMINDLKAAIPLLPEVQQSPPAFRHSLIDKAAAKALLARILLYKGDWQQAKNIAREVITTVPIMSIAQGYPSKLFTNDETEAIFQLVPSSSSVPSSAGNYDYIFSGAVFGGAAHLLVATNDIAFILQENPADVRSAWVVKSNANWNIKKYPSNLLPGFAYPEASYYQTLIRSSEMYLTSAECYARLNNQDSAVYFLDAIRKRSWPDAPPTTATGAALIDSVYKERRKELAFEGFRMFDIQRWKQAVVRIDAPVSTAQQLPYGSNKAIAPIPTSDVEAGMEQNPGY